MRRAVGPRLSAFGLALLLWPACLSAPPETSDSGGEDDAGPVDAASNQVCDERFGDLRGYQACAPGPTCDFWIDLSAETTCQFICSEGGATCLQSYDSSAETPCVREEAEDCVGLHNTLICICDPA